MRRWNDHLIEREMSRSWRQAFAAAAVSAVLISTTVAVIWVLTGTPWFPDILMVLGGSLLGALVPRAVVRTRARRSR
jgi:hypothetical protein